MDYIKANEWFLTATKLKDFMKYWPEVYKLKYIDKAKEQDDKRCFVVWNAFDDLVSYWWDFFSERYYIDEWLVVADLKQKLIDMWKSEKEIKSMKLPELRALYYNNSDDKKIRLTPSEWESIMWMYREAVRQPLTDMLEDYETQKVLESEVDWVPIRWTLDRINVDKWIIRDWKTTGRIDKFEYSIDEFWYDISMSFYYMLGKQIYNKKFDVILDVLGKQDPYVYIGYRLTPKIMESIIEDKILPAIYEYKQCLESNNRPNTKDRMTLIDSGFYELTKGAVQSNMITPLWY